MGVTNGRDLLSSKYQTAIIIDSVNTMHFVPIKNPIGDYFFVTINSELYAFDTKGDTYKWRPKLAKTFECLIYFTDHYKPLSSELKELEQILEKNDLPKMSSIQHKLFSLLKLREKKDFQSFDLQKLQEELENTESDETRAALNKDIINYIKELAIEKIVTPVKRVTNYLDESLLATDPKFMGSVKTAVQLAMTENREVNHTPIGPAKGWLKVAIVGILIMAVGGMLYMAYEQGYFDSLISMIPGQSIGSGGGGLFGGGPEAVQTDLLTKYPTPESAKAAIDRGEVELNDFPPNMRDAIKAVETPQT